MGGGGTQNDATIISHPGTVRKTRQCAFPCTISAPVVFIHLPLKRNTRFVPYSSGFDYAYLRPDTFETSVFFLKQHPGKFDTIIMWEMRSTVEFRH